MQLTTRFKANEDYQKQFIYSDRSYFLTSEATTQTAYNLGYKDGQRDGFAEGEQVGFEDGYSKGQAYGESVGFNKGVASANDYTFLGLMGAVVDAPITALSGLLNFNILGFNMLNLFYGILTLALILFVVRLIL